MKLKLKILSRILENATAKEIDFLVFTLRYQNNIGVVSGITAKDICDAIHIHRSSFNNILHSLEDKKIISVDWSNENTKSWSFKLINNIFWEDEDYKEGYINLNTRFLYTEEFIDLKRNEKIIMLTFLARFRANRESMIFTFDKIMEWTGCNLRSVKAFVKTLKDKFFHNQMTITDEKIIIDTTDSNNIVIFGRLHDETDLYNEHELDTIIRNTGAEIDEENKKSVIKMYKQFAKYGRDIITEAILTCIKNQGRKIIAPYINTIIHIISNRRKAFVNELINTSKGLIFS